MLNRTQSFQNCRETDVPGYNDCPNFIIPSRRHTGTGMKKAASNSQIDTFGSTKVATAPPPIMRRRVTSHGITLSEGASTSPEPCKPKSEIWHELDAVLARDTKLSPAEFLYYKNKLLAGVDKTLDQEHGRQLMGQALASLQDKEKVYKLLADWMMADTSTSTWIPSLRKIVANLK
ncbi:LADA_0F12728g1_1 [Lachancea dasiensis]|uniref:LADA_0F12728g1_1 n=1 Tax=Lachancea dasiensis TaxID=1072105 RepID=A0A1G4JN52_9SACH|nr:LADA_0F12728g1_1 [Lachancea dasiensis]